jgi:hypothetical protein
MTRTPRTEYKPANWAGGAKNYLMIGASETAGVLGARAQTVPRRSKFKLRQRQSSDLFTPRDRGANIRVRRSIHEKI